MKKEIGVVWDKQEESNRKFKLKTILEKNQISFNKNLIEFTHDYSLDDLPIPTWQKIIKDNKYLFKKAKLKNKQFIDKNIY